MPSATLYPVTTVDDCYVYLSSPFTFSNTDTTVYVFPGYALCLRIPELPIPPGSTINSMTLNLPAISTSGTSDMTADFSAFNEDDSPAVTGYANYTGRSQVTAINKTITRTGIPTTKSITGLAALVQAIVDRGGYVLDKAFQMPVFNAAPGGSFFEFKAYGSTPTWSIDVDWTEAASGGGTAANLLLLGCG